MPQAVLQKLLKKVGDGTISMDCSVQPTRLEGIFTVQTTDFFYPLVDDPYLQGKVGCANVLSDLYAMGVSECDNMLMILAGSREMDNEHMEIVTQRMIAGFNDLCEEAGTRVTGGQTVLNPWPIIGGVATATCREQDFIRPELAVPGDVLVLTKPLGTQVSVNLHEWSWAKDGSSGANFWARVAGTISRDEVRLAYGKAVESMVRLNRNGAKLMHKYGAHGCTDVTGFGILGHAANLAHNQRRDVHFTIQTLPVIAGMAAVDAVLGGLFKLKDGYSAETSGGLLIILPRDAAAGFCAELTALDGMAAWIIGDVQEAPTKGASIAADVTFISV